MINNNETRHQKHPPAPFFPTPTQTIQRASYDRACSYSVSFAETTRASPHTEATPLEPQLIKFEKKIEAGAEFIQTQAVYDLDKLKSFMEYARQFPVKILAGIILLTSAPMARFMNKNIAGVNVPQDLIDEMASAQKGTALIKGIEIAGRMIRQIHEEKMCDGVHIMAIGKEEKVPDIMAAAGLD